MDRLKFILSLITRDNDYQQEQSRAAEAAAARLNVDLETLYSDSDSVTQSSQILDAIHKYKGSLRGILVEPGGGTEFPQIGRAAVSTRIAWVLLNRDAGSLGALRGNTTPAFAVTSNHAEVGRIQARQLSTLLPDGGFVLYVQGPSSTPVARDRLAGFQDAKPENLTLKLVKSANWTEEGGRHSVSSWLRLSTSQLQEIRAVAGQNDFIAKGARQAFKDAGDPRWSRIPFLGVDGQPATGRAWVQQGLLTATIEVPPVAGSALEIAVAAITKKVQPHDLHLIPCASFPLVETLRPLARANA